MALRAMLEMAIEALKRMLSRGRDMEITPFIPKVNIQPEEAVRIGLPQQYVVRKAGVPILAIEYYLDRYVVYGSQAHRLVEFVSASIELAGRYLTMIGRISLSVHGKDSTFEKVGAPKEIISAVAVPEIAITPAYAVITIGELEFFADVNGSNREQPHCGMSAPYQLDIGNYTMMRFFTDSSLTDDDIQRIEDHLAAHVYGGNAR